MSERTCHNCAYCGMDMDLDPYCAAPEVTKKYQFGLVLHSTMLREICPAPEHPLFQLRKKKT